VTHFHQDGKIIDVDERGDERGDDTDDEVKRR
jgi:hypothetical protein